MWGVQNWSDLKLLELRLLRVSNSFHQEEASVLSLNGHMSDMLLEFICSGDGCFLSLLGELHVFFLPGLDVSLQKFLFRNHDSVV